MSHLAVSGSTAWHEGETERGLPRSARPVEVTWHVYQQVRSIYTATSPAAGRKTAEKVLESLHTCPIPEVAKLGRTLRQWRN